MPLRFSNRILDHLTHGSYRPSPVKTIVRDLRISPEDRLAFDEAFDQAVSDGFIEVGRDDCVRLPTLPDEISGVYRSNKRGFGFVKPDQFFREGDVYIAANASGDAVSGDQVLVSVSKGDRWKGRGAAGKIIEVLNRGRGEFVGSLFKRGNTWFAQPD
ncbi:MAG: hypothetical protein QGF07_04605, partial [Phycisphaerales bacterium]|nr:hypothetical protein [Phycisphaerales bacterium]